MSGQDDLTEIKISAARIEEKVQALMASTSLQAITLSSQLDKLASKEQVEDLDARVQKLEAAQSWLVKSVIATAAAALASLSGLSRKIGL